MLADISRTKRSRNTKIGRNIAHTTGNKVVKGAPVSRSNFKVTRSANVEIGCASYRAKRKVYKLETWNACGVRRPVSSTSAMTSAKFKGHVMRPTSDGRYVQKETS